MEKISHEDILDIKYISTLGNSLKNSHNESVKIGDLKIVKFIKNDNKIFYKTSYEQDDFQFIELKQTRNNKNRIVVLRKLYSTKPKLGEKKKSILSLFKKNAIPKYYLNFFNNL